MFAEFMKDEIVFRYYQIYSVTFSQVYGQYFDHVSACGLWWYFCNSARKSNLLCDRRVVMSMLYTKYCTHILFFKKKNKKKGMVKIERAGIWNMEKHLQLKNK